MAWTPRRIDPDGLAATIDLTAAAFGVGPRATESYRRQASLVAEPDRVFVVDDGRSPLLGGVTWATRRRAGLVEERAPGAAARADSMFRPERAPYCSTDF